MVIFLIFPFVHFFSEYFRCFYGILIDMKIIIIYHHGSLFTSSLAQTFFENERIWIFIKFLISTQSRKDIRRKSFRTRSTVTDFDDFFLHRFYCFRNPNFSCIFSYIFSRSSSGSGERCFLISASSSIPSAVFLSIPWDSR